jgi:putative sugar O-methyltransferase
MNNINIKLSEKFIISSKKFFDDEKLNLDNKHKEIIREFYKKYRKDNNYFKKNLRNWSMQSDYATPPQISFEGLKKNGFLYGFFFQILKYIYSKINPMSYSGFFDDLEIIKKFTNYDIFKINPVHNTPNAKSFYMLDNNTSTNVRWNRYGFIANQIKSFNLLNNKSTWIDIGSYYGGLQSFVKKLYPESNMILVDFYHQLCRSYVFLKQMFPMSNHILPYQISNNFNLKNKLGHIVYMPINKFLNTKIRCDLITNFFSFGEMKIEFLKNYLNHYNYKNAKYKYIINRYVGSPFFEKTYDTNVTILDYNLEKKKIIYFDMHPIQHFQLQNRKLYGKKIFRSRSSDHFEAIYK